MYINKLSLKNYRNLETINIELENGINIFYGNNAQGKTNLLESIYICSTGRSHRTHIDKELINFKENEAHIKINFLKDNNFEKINIHLKKDTKKGIAINDIPIKKIGELFGKLNTVIFSPEDLQIVKSGPSERRKFIDIELCQLSNIYYYNLQQYYKILKHRNNLLKKIQKDNKQKDTLFIWDNQLVNFGNKIIDYRKNFIEKINKISKDIHFKITDFKEELKIEYKESVNQQDFENKLKKCIEKDIIYGSTSCGPHKDDLIFYVNGINIKEFGSQGQQRTASLSTKLSEIEIIKQERNVTPILLLDDVLSELDEYRQNFLINFIKNIQTIITCTGIESIVKKFSSHCNIYMVENGKILKNNKYF